MNDIQIRKVAFGGYHRGDVEQVLSQTQNAAAQQREALRAVQAERDALEEQRSALQQENAALQAALADKTGEADTLQAALDGKVKENSNLAFMLREIQQSWHKLSDELEAQEAALEKQHRLFDELLQEYGKLEDKLARCNQAGRLAKEGGDKAAQALTGVTARLQEIRSQVREVDAALDRDRPGC